MGRFDKHSEIGARGGATSQEAMIQSLQEKGLPQNINLTDVRYIDLKRPDGVNVLGSSRVAVYNEKDNTFIVFGRDNLVRVIDAQNYKEQNAKNEELGERRENPKFPKGMNPLHSTCIISAGEQKLGVRIPFYCPHIDNIVINDPERRQAYEEGLFKYNNSGQANSEIYKMAGKQKVDDAKGLYAKGVAMWKGATDEEFMAKRDEVRLEGANQLAGITLTLKDLLDSGNAHYQEEKKAVENTAEYQRKQAEDYNSLQF